MNILIGGDLAPCNKAEKIFETGNVRRLLGNKLLKIWDTADYRFFNLECPITDSDEKIAKCGPCLKCSSNAICGIKEMNPSCVFLANNHIMDYTANGFRDTINALGQNGIEWVGVGENEKTLKKDFVFNAGMFKVGIYNCCEREFSIVSKDSPGANPYDEFTITNDLSVLKRKVDFLIVIYHGGNEHYRYPSPYLQKRCHKMIEDGADLLVCQHSHCVGCEEKYNGRIIVYGQGNFIFNKLRNEFWNTSLLINLILDVDGFKLEYIPIVQSEYGTRLANKKESNEILDGYKQRSEKIKQNVFIQKEYEKYAREKLLEYLLRIKTGFWMRVIRKIFPSALTKYIFNCEDILNSIDCEAHRELFIQGLKDVISDKKNDGEK